VDGRAKPGHDDVEKEPSPTKETYAAFRDARKSPMRSSALRMFSVELA
jgi:hypothetical protein